MPLEYAAPWRRGAAFLLDAVLVAPVAVWAPLAAVGVWAVTGALFEASSWQATPGKRALGLRVMEAEGRRVGWRRAAVRQVAKLGVVAAVAGGAGWGWAVAFAALAAPAVGGGRRRTVWDRVAGTSVFAPPIGSFREVRYGADV